MMNWTPLSGFGEVDPPEDKDEGRHPVRLPGNHLALAEIVDRHVSKATGIMYGIALLEGERVSVIQYEWWEYWYVDRPTGLTQAEREAIAETEIPFLFDLPEDEQIDSTYE